MLLFYVRLLLLCWAHQGRRTPDTNTVEKKKEFVRKALNSCQDGWKQQRGELSGSNPWLLARQKCAAAPNAFVLPTKNLLFCTFLIHQRWKFRLFPMLNLEVMLGSSLMIHLHLMIAKTSILRVQFQQSVCVCTSNYLLNVRQTWVFVLIHPTLGPDWKLLFLCPRSTSTS